MQLLTFVIISVFVKTGSIIEYIGMTNATETKFKVMKSIIYNSRFKKEYLSLLR
jgi:hypothetical protein